MRSLFLFFIKEQRRVSSAAAFLVAALLTFALLPLRNYLVTGRATPAALTYTRDWERPDVDLSPPLNARKIVQTTATTALFYGKRILFCLGLTFFELPIHWLRPHWLIIWGGAFWFCWQRAKKRRLDPWIVCCITFIVLYLGPLVAVAQIYNYGVRMIVPVLPVLLVLAVAAMRERFELPRPGKRRRELAATSAVSK